MRVDIGFKHTDVRRKGIFFSLLFFLVLNLLAVPLLNANQDPLNRKDDYFEYDSSQDKKWQESRVTLPAYPEDQNLLALPMQPTDTLKVSVDRASVSRDADRVARFSIVVESRSGARSIFYDGYRCETREYKTYALGSLDKKLIPVKTATWVRVPQPEFNAFRFRLYRDYVCDSSDSARDPKDLVRLLSQ